MTTLVHALAAFILLLPTLTHASESLKVLVFNIQKMENRGWDAKVFSSLVNGVDITLLQEALDTPPIIDKGTDWRFYKSWENQSYQTGLATLSKYTPVESEILFSPTNEPISNTPKISVLERYELKDHGENLTVINTHGINFRGLSHFKNQMNEVYKKIKDHEGPMIWAGDFNTRSSSRTRHLKSLTDKLGMIEVHFKDRSSLFFTLDRAYIRGLKVVKASEIKVDISDHEPLLMELEFFK